LKAYMENSFDGRSNIIYIYIYETVTTLFSVYYIYTLRAEKNSRLFQNYIYIHIPISNE